MIFANVTDWTITEGSVKRVTDSLGNILWEKQTTPAEYFYVEDASGSANTLTIKKNVGNSAPTIRVYYSTDQTNWSLLGNTSTTGLTLNIPADSKVYLKATTNSWTVAGAGNNNWIGCSADFNIGGNIMSLIAGDNYRNASLIDGTNDYAFSGVFENDNYLVDTSNLILPNTVSNNCYREMFFMCDNLLTAPSLPATTLATWCYYWMFYGCTSLTTAPATLPATTLTNRCYDSMFFGCTSLTSAPALPATTLADYCYTAMFRGCTSLTTAPALPATTLADYCYQSMFTNTAITTAPDLPATTLTTSCYSQMFSSCSNLNYIKIYADDITASNCLASWLQNVAATGDFYNEGSATYPTNSPSGIPTGWTEHKTITNEYFYIEDLSGAANTLSITKSGSTAPTIEVFYSTDQQNWTSMGSTSTTAITATVPANSKLYLKATANSWVYSSKSNYISCSNSFNVGGYIMSLLYGDNFEGQTTFPSGTTQNFRQLFYNATSLVNANKLFLTATTLANFCYNGMFQGCTSLTTAPALPATTLANNCYALMFSGCSSLVTAPALPATTLANACYINMFNGCTSLTSAPTLPATTLATTCYSSMFYNCTALTTAPVLPATTLASGCYRNMFYGCTSLTTAPALPATTLADNCYYAMFNGCTSLTSAPTLPATTLVSGCYRNMFKSCENLNSVTTYANDISANTCLENWLSGVAATGDFYNLGSATYPSGVNGIPSGWTEHSTL